MESIEEKAEQEETVPELQEILFPKFWGLLKTQGDQNVKQSEDTSSEKLISQNDDPKKEANEDSQEAKEGAPKRTRGEQLFKQPPVNALKEIESAPAQQTTCKWRKVTDKVSKTSEDASKEETELNVKRECRVSILRLKSLDDLALKYLEVEVKSIKGLSEKASGYGKRAAIEDCGDNKPAKALKETSSKSTEKEKIPDVTALDFGNKSTSPDGKPSNLKIPSRNINSVRACMEEENKSNYEKMVQKNREERVAFLEALEINEIKADLNVGNQNLKPKGKGVKKKNCSDLPPPRKKRRGLVRFDLSEKALLNKAWMGYKEEPMGYKEEPMEQKELPPFFPFKEVLKRHTFSSFLQDFEGLERKEVPSTPYNEYVSRFNRMKLSDIVQVVPGRFSALEIHPMCEKSVIMSGDAKGNLSFWNMQSDPYLFTPHDNAITHLKINPFHANIVISSSYDGTVLCGDLEKHIFNEVYCVSEPRDGCTYFDVISPTTYLIAHRFGNVAVVDQRSDSKTVEKIHHSHDNKVTSVSIHPIRKNYFLSSECKGAIAMWDLRNLQKKPVNEVYQHEKSCLAALFSPRTGKSILSTLGDHKLCLFNSSKLLFNIPLRTVIRPVFDDQHTRKKLRATWLPNVDDVFVVGSCRFPRRIEIYNAKGSNIHNFFTQTETTLTSPHAFHPSMPLLAAGSSHGKVFVFTDST